MPKPPTTLKLLANPGTLTTFTHGLHVLLVSNPAGSNTTQSRFSQAIAFEPAQQRPDSNRHDEGNVVNASPRFPELFSAARA
jgi:hypothetical protein